MSQDKKDVSGIPVGGILTTDFDRMAWELFSNAMSRNIAKHNTSSAEIARQSLKAAREFVRQRQEFAKIKDWWDSP